MRPVLSAHIYNSMNADVISTWVLHIQYNVNENLFFLFVCAFGVFFFLCVF